MSATPAAAVASTVSGFQNYWLPKISGQLNGVAAISHRNVWAVGGSRGPAPLVMHWNGRGWHIASVAFPGDYARLSSISALSRSNVWAVGESVTSGHPRPLVAHWNGSSWRLWVPSDVQQDTWFQGVYAASPTDVSAVGTDDSSLSFGGLVGHWNGHRWALETVAAARGYLWSVTKTQDLGVLAVDRNSGSVFEKMGGGWSQLSSPTECSYCWLADIAHTPSGQVWGVGGGGFVNGQTAAVAEHWAPSGWQAFGVGTTYMHILQGLAPVSDTNVWAVGYREAPHNGHYNDRTLIAHWNGTSWADLGGPNLGTGNDTLSAVAAVPGTAHELWAVGQHDGWAMIFHHP
jgi:hypothetical protein